MIEQRPLGKSGPRIGRLGYGAMVLDGVYGASDDAQGMKALRRAMDEGFTMIDTADVYGAGHNESLIGKAIAGRRDQVFLATKFGIVFDDSAPGHDFATNWNFSLKINGGQEYAHRCLDASLKRLGVDHIDLWYIHYPDPLIPIEDTVGTMARAVEQGKVRHLGLSNVTARQVCRAHAVHTIAAVQYEYSLWRREAEQRLLPTLRELGIALVPWSPLGSGFLAGDVSIGADDMRHMNPRYTEQNMAINRDRFAPLRRMAEAIGATPAQLALAWLLHQGDDIFPIPGTRKPERIPENAGAAKIVLDEQLLREIDQVAVPGIAEGGIFID